jgi:hypothetical protein
VPLEIILVPFQNAFVAIAVHHDVMALERIRNVSDVTNAIVIIMPEEILRVYPLGKTAPAIICVK